MLANNRHPAAAVRALLGCIYTMGPSLFAFFGLIAIQVTIAVVYKIAGASGKYKFSQASSLAISEGVKIILSLFLLILSTKAELALNGASIGVLPTHSASSNRSNSSSDLRTDADENSGDGTRLLDRRDGKDRDTLSPVSNASRMKYYSNSWNGAIEKTRDTLKGAYSKPILIPIAGLAALYAFNNHFAFFLFLLVDPGTISLVKSGSTFLSASILWFFGRTTNRLQWVAILLQVFGIIASQYDPCKGGMAYHISSYALLFMSVTITALSGCINDHITKSFKLPLHAINAYLYSFGFLFNMIVFFFISITNPDSPGLFEGYDGIAMTVVLCNCLIGLAITFVYKYADAVIKTIAQTVSTGVLLFISALIFGAPLGVLPVTGVLVVFTSAYLYFVVGSGALGDAIKTIDSKNSPPVDPSVIAKRPKYGAMLGISLFFMLGFIYVQNPPTMLSKDEKSPLVAPEVRIAHCMVGSASTLLHPDVYTTYRMNAMDPTPKIQHDLFIVTRLGSEAEKVRSSDGTYADTTSYTEAIEYLKPVKHAWINSDSQSTLKSCDRPLLEKCHSEVISAEKAGGFKYKYIIRSRPDTVFLRPLPPVSEFLKNEVALSVARSSMYDIVPISYQNATMSWKHPSGLKGVEDGFAIVPRNLASAYFEGVASTGSTKCSGVTAEPEKCECELLDILDSGKVSWSMYPVLTRIKGTTEMCSNAKHSPALIC